MKELTKESKEVLDEMVLRNWSYFELQNFIKYKAAKNGIKLVFEK